MKFIKQKQFYKTLLLLSAPIMFQNLLTFGLNLMDTVMLGKYGEISISASSVAGQPFLILSMILFGISSGASVLAAQYFGKKDIKTITSILGYALKVTFIVSSIIFLICFLFPKPILYLWSGDNKVVEMGKKYLQIVSFSYILTAISMVYLNIIRSVEKVKFSLIIRIVSFFANVFLNWVLIFGNLGFEEMGIKGAAIATLISRIIEFLAVFVYAFRHNKLLKLNFTHFKRLNSLLRNDFYKFSLPVTINETLWGLGMSAFMAILGHMGSEVMAAANIVGISQRLLMVAAFGIANAAAVIIGKKIGEGKKNEVMAASNSIFAICAGFGVLSAVIIIILRPFVPLFFNISEITKGYVTSMFFVSAEVVFLVSINATNIVGVLRGGGDIKAALLIDILPMWFFALPLGFLAAFVFKLPVWLVFFILTSDEIIKFFVGMKRYKSEKWINNVTRELN